MRGENIKVKNNLSCIFALGALGGSFSELFLATQKIIKNFIIFFGIYAYCATRQLGAHNIHFIELNA